MVELVRDVSSNVLIPDYTAFENVIVTSYKKLHVINLPNKKKKKKEAKRIWVVVMLL